MRSVALAGLLAVVSFTASKAQTPPVITEAEFLSVLDEDHPAVAESAATLATTRASLLAAATLENPKLSGVREEPSSSIEQTDWALSWQLPGASRRPLIEARRHDVDAAAQRLSQDLALLRFMMREVYAGWALSSVREESLGALASRIEALAERQAARAQRGEVSVLDVRRLELAAATLRSQVALAVVASERARAQARAWSPTLSSDDQPVLPELPSMPDLTSSHPLVVAARADLAARQLEGQAAGRFVATPELSLGWQEQRSESDSIAGPTLGIGWSLPLFDRHRAEKAASAAQIVAAEARLERLEREVTAARPAAQATFERLLVALESIDAVLDTEGRILEGAEAAFRQGELSLTDLLDTHRSVTEATLARIDLYGAALAAHRDLERLSGTSLPLSRSLLSDQ